MKHELKVWPKPFESLWTGTKKFEFRKDDRGFKVGDELFLREWCPESKDYVGDTLTYWVSYIARGPEWGIPEGFCIMSLDCEPVEVES